MARRHRLPLGLAFVLVALAYMALSAGLAAVLLQHVGSTAGAIHATRAAKLSPG